MFRGKKIAAEFAAYFREVSHAFFDIQEKDGTADSRKKVAKTVSRRIAYSLADYWLAGVSAALMIGMKVYGYEFVHLFFAMWSFDIAIACAFIAVWQRTGHDLTLGEDYRRAVDVMHAKSRGVGRVAIGLVCAKACVWDGPEHIVIFFRKEIRTEARMAFILLVLTALQAVVWAAVYSFGYDSVSELWRYLWSRFVA